MRIEEHKARSDIKDSIQKIDQSIQTLEEIMYRKGFEDCLAKFPKVPETEMDAIENFIIWAYTFKVDFRCVYSSGIEYISKVLDEYRKYNNSKDM